MHAFNTPNTDGDRKKLNKLLKKPVSEVLSKELFDYSAFLRGLGRMNLST